ncbi:MAG: hypothetical protein U5J63_14470 [Fodinibius sp.]|nr:hypothetical protein [Fodinibius sp.]
MSISRKHFLKQAGAMALGFSGLQLFSGCTSNNQQPTGQSISCRSFWPSAIGSQWTL